MNIETANKGAPRDAADYVQLAKRLALAGRLHDAVDAIAQAERLGPRSAAELDLIGTIYSLSGDQTRALACFEKAVSASPTAHFLYNLATAQRMTGNLAAAEATCDSVIALDPHDYHAYHTRADLRRYTVEHNHIKPMMVVVDSGTKHWQGDVLLRYAIAKECEDIGDYRRSFENLKAGADLQRRHMRYRVDDEIAVIDKIIETHTADALSRRQGAASQEPIFVVGMPRTGTTLVERILGSHSVVKSLGELNSFPAEMQKAVASHTGSNRTPVLKMVEEALNIDHEALGHAYTASACARTGRTARFIDKMPQNYLNCGLIHAALPNAKIIHVARDAMDTCYAVYKTYFNGMYPFSFDLEELGKYYLAYRRLMDHWRDVLGDAMLEMSYEKLVNDQVGQTKRLLEYCGLEWQDACLRFHESAAPSTTASASQVREPIYRTSVGRWRCYEDQLRPLKVLLEGPIKTGSVCA